MLVSHVILLHISNTSYTVDHFAIVEEILPLGVFGV